MKNAGVALSGANNTIDESIGLLIAANAAMQDMNKASTAIRTISLRLRNSAADLRDMGEESEFAAESITKLQRQMLDLTEGKIDIMIDDTSFKSTYDIMLELSQVWSTLSDISKAEIVKLVAGQRGAVALESIMANIQDMVGATTTSLESQGTALEMNAIQMESIQGKIDALKISFQEFAKNAIDSGLIKFFVDLAKSILDVINKAGGLNFVILATIGILARFKPAIFISLLNGITKALKGNVDGVNTLSSALITLIKTSWAAILANWQILLLAVAVAIAVTTVAALSYGNTLEGATEKLKKLSQAHKELLSELEPLEEKLKTNSDRIQEIQSLETLSITDQVDLERLEEENKLLVIQIDLLKKRATAKETEISQQAIKTAEAFSKAYLEESPRMRSGQVYESSLARQIKLYNDLFDEQQKLNKEIEGEAERYIEIEKELKLILGQVGDIGLQAEEIRKNIEVVDDETKNWYDTLSDVIEQAFLLGKTEIEIKEFRFANILDSEEYKDVKRALEDLGNAGELSADKLADTKFTEFMRVMSNIGVSTDDIINIFQKFRDVIDVDVIPTFDDLRKNFDDSVATMDTLKKAQKEYEDQGYLSGEMMTELNKLGPEYIGLLFDQEGAFLGLNEAVREHLELEVKENIEGLNVILKEQNEELDELRSNFEEYTLDDFIEAEERALNAIAQTNIEISNQQAFLAPFPVELSKTAQGVQDYIDVMNLLEQAQQQYNEEGYLSIDMLGKIIDADSDLLNVLFDQTGAYTGLTQTVRDYIKAKADVKIITLKETLREEEKALNLLTGEWVRGKIKEEEYIAGKSKLDASLQKNRVEIEATEEALRKFNNKILTLDQQLDLVESSYKTLDNALKEYIENKGLSLNTVRQLMELEWEYIAALDLSSGKIELNIEKLKELTAQLQHKTLMRLAEAAADDIAAYASGNLAGLSDIAKRATAGLGDSVASMGDKMLTAAQSVDVLTNSVARLLDEMGVAISEGAQKGADLILETYQGIASNIGNIFGNINWNSFTSGSSAAGKKAGKEAGDKWKEAFENELKELQYLLDKSLISQEEYYRRLESLNNKYFAGKKQYLDEYRKYELEVLNGLAKIEEDRIQTQLKIAERSNNFDEQLRLYQQLQQQTLQTKQQYIALGMKETDVEILQLIDKYQEYADKMVSIHKSMYESIKRDRELLYLEGAISETQYIQDSLSALENYGNQVGRDDDFFRQERISQLQAYYESSRKKAELYYLEGTITEAQYYRTSLALLEEYAVAVGAKDDFYRRTRISNAKSLYESLKKNWELEYKEGKVAIEEYYDGYLVILEEYRRLIGKEDELFRNERIRIHTEIYEGVKSELALRLKEGLISETTYIATILLELEHLREALGEHSELYRKELVETHIGKYEAVEREAKRLRDEGITSTVTYYGNLLHETEEFGKQFGKHHDFYRQKRVENEEGMYKAMKQSWETFYLQGYVSQKEYLENILLMNEEMSNLILNEENVFADKYGKYNDDLIRERIETAKKLADIANDEMQIRIDNIDNIISVARSRGEEELEVTIELNREKISLLKQQQQREHELAQEARDKRIEEDTVEIMQRQKNYVELDMKILATEKNIADAVQIHRDRIKRDLKDQLTDLEFLYDTRAADDYIYAQKNLKERIDITTESIRQDTLALALLNNMVENGTISAEIAKDAIDGFNQSIRDGEKALEKFNDELEKNNKSLIDLGINFMKAEIKELEEQKKLAKEVYDERIKLIEKEIETLRKKWDEEDKAIEAEKDKEELLKHQEDQQKKLLEIEKLRAELEKTRNERNIRQLKQISETEYEFEYVADLNKIEDLQEKIVDKQKEYADAEIAFADKQAEKLRKAQRDADLEALEKKKKTLEDARDLEQEDFDDRIKRLYAFVKKVEDALIDDSKWKIKNIKTLLETIEKEEKTSNDKRLTELKSFLNEWSSLVKEMESPTVGSDLISISASSSSLPKAASGAKIQKSGAIVAHENEQILTEKATLAAESIVSTLNDKNSIFGQLSNLSLVPNLEKLLKANTNFGNITNNNQSGGNLTINNLSITLPDVRNSDDFIKSMKAFKSIALQEIRK